MDAKGAKRKVDKAFTASPLDAIACGALGLCVGEARALSSREQYFDDQADQLFPGTRPAPEEINWPADVESTLPQALSTQAIPVTSQALAVRTSNV